MSSTSNVCFSKSQITVKTHLHQTNKLESTMSVVVFVIFFSMVDVFLYLYSLASVNFIYILLE